MSIVIPMYNVRDYISDCLLSCLNQKISNEIKYEIILVDDGSLDDSLSIAKSIPDDRNLIKIIEQPNGGVARARNKGIELAVGQYIGFLDSDDWLSENYVQSIYESVTKYQSDIVYFDRNLHHEKSIKSVHYPLLKLDISTNKSIFTLLNLSSCNKVYKRNVINTTRFPTDVIYEDFPFTIKMLIKSKTISKAKGILYQVRSFRVGSITNSINSNEIELYNNLVEVEKYLNKKGINEDLIENYKVFKDRQLIGWLFKHIKHKKCFPVKISDLNINFNNLKSMNEKVGFILIVLKMNWLLSSLLIVRKLIKK
ncbi:glycosyltransferase family 2 protein [Aliivibrio fischeri]|uniref:Glycosyltransferase n=1 Tax=Aliivibrio fischeri TaxID=668 RepID=A0A844P111_ALIFS|nr:glycosyltransferase family 2 protein [Aliivibrio fischeri]MUK49030.1 glycosyltransferase [Aliivibrio fischeri]